MSKDYFDLPIGDVARAISIARGEVAQNVEYGTTLVNREKVLAFTFGLPAREWHTVLLDKPLSQCLESILQMIRCRELE